MKTSILPPIFGQMWLNPLPGVMNSEMFLFLAIIVQMDTTCVRDSGTIWQGRNSSSHFSTQISWHSTDCYTSFVTCISQTVTKKLTRMTTIVTDWKMREIVYNFNVTYLKFFKTFRNWRGGCTFQRESCIPVIYPKEKQTFWYWNL
jgi:hypothetical protein